MVEDKISAGLNTSSSASSSDADTSILSGQFSDVSASSATIQPTSGLEHLALLIPCETDDDVKKLDEAMKDCASRQWMVRSDTYSGSILLNVLLNNTLIIYIPGHIMKISDIGNAMCSKNKQLYAHRSTI